VSAAHWLGNLAAWSAQAAVLIAAGGLAAWAFRLRVPRIRLAYWQTLLAICLLLPAVEPWRSAADSNIEISIAAARPVSGGRVPAFPLPWRQAVLFVLASGCAARALWLAVGFGKLRRWRRDARCSRSRRASICCARPLRRMRTFGCRRPWGVRSRSGCGGRWSCCRATSPNCRRTSRKPSSAMNCCTCAATIGSSPWRSKPSARRCGFIQPSGG
jgi:hypothetical protein